MLFPCFRDIICLFFIQLTIDLSKAFPAFAAFEIEEASLEVKSISLLAKITKIVTKRKALDVVSSSVHGTWLRPLHVVSGDTISMISGGEEKVISVKKVDSTALYFF